MTRALLGLVMLAACSDPPPPPPRRADPIAGALVFQEKCANCHTIGSGMRTGHDLHGVTKRRPHPWVLRMLKDPIGMTKTDPIARVELAAAKNVPMPPPNLTDAQIDDVLAFIEQESAHVPAR